jgi:hypothetical protein
MASLFNLNPAAAPGNRPPPTRHDNSTPESNMRITKIEFSNYKAMQDSTLDLGKINLLV